MKFRTQYTLIHDFEFNDSISETREDMTLSPRQLLERWSQGYLIPPDAIGPDGGYDGDFDDNDDMFDAVHYDLLNRLGMDLAEADEIVNSLEENIRAYELRQPVKDSPKDAAPAAVNEDDPAPPESPE